MNADEAYFQLECPLVLSDTSTESDIQWSMGLSPLYQSPFIVPFGSVLLFQTVLYSHQGEYTCTYNHMTYSTFLEVLGQTVFYSLCHWLLCNLLFYI